jgi:oligoendopeptidase F
MKTTWNLTLLYKNDKDPALEKDLKMIEQSCANFEKKYKGKGFINSPDELKKVLTDYEVLIKNTADYKPWSYFALRNDLDSNDDIAGALATQNMQRLTVAFNKIQFIDLNIGKIPVSKQSAYLKDPSLADYHYFLKKIFERSKHLLSEGEEQLSSLLAQPAYIMWVEAQEKLLNQQTVKHKGKILPFQEVISKIPEMSKDDRRKTQNEINRILKSISHMAESEINAVFNYKKILDIRRGYEKPYSATVMDYENSQRSIEALINLVSKKFHIAHRFYKLHARLIGEKKITVADRKVKIGKIKTKFTFEKSVSLLNEVLYGFDKEYAGILQSFVKNGQIDVYPKKGKKGGAYCWGSGMLPTFVLLNHVDNVRSLETLAHEMGHAIHTEMSKRQRPFYRSYSYVCAETASTFFEGLMNEEIGKHLNGKEKMIWLHNKIMNSIEAIFRQTAGFNFELELHQEIRRAGQLSKEKMAALLAKHYRSYMGPAVLVNDDDGYFFVNWSHIRRFFYVYSYVYGQLISRTLLENWKADPSYSKKIKQFLSAGGSMSPEDIFKSIGIDSSKPEFFEAGLRGVEKDIDELEKLANKN